MRQTAGHCPYQRWETSNVMDVAMQNSQRQLFAWFDPVK
jgi:hypothetical protein